MILSKILIGASKLVYLNGMTMRRKFVFWEKNFGYDLFINQISYFFKCIENNILITDSIDEAIKTLELVKASKDSDRLNRCIFLK